MGETTVFQVGETLLSAIASTLSATSLWDFWEWSFSSNDEGWIEDSEVTLGKHAPVKPIKACRFPVVRYFCLFVGRCFRDPKQTKLQTNENRYVAETTNFFPFALNGRMDCLYEFHGR